MNNARSQDRLCLAAGSRRQVEPLDYVCDEPLCGFAAGFVTPACVSDAPTCCILLMSATAAAGGRTRRHAGSGGRRSGIGLDVIDAANRKFDAQRLSIKDQVADGGGKRFSKSAAPSALDLTDMGTVRARESDG